MLMQSTNTRLVARTSIRGLASRTLSILLLFSLLSCRRPPHGFHQSQTSQPEPPDLSGCTRIVIRYLPSLLEHGFRGARRTSVLNPAEMAYIKSSDPIVVEQKERIEALAQSIGLGVYYDTSQSIPGVADVANVTCYWGDEQTASFVFKRGPFIRFGDGKWFDYGHTHLVLFESATDIQPLVQRADCADNLGRLMEYWSPRVGPAPQRPTEDEWDVWCDVTVGRSLHGLMDSEKEEYVAYVVSRFRCPAALDGKYHYAANPHCELDSPGNTVFVFETKPGWNQHGGPELFTFDNHNPKGGCVLLNDGTVKFIRTEEELKQLRWK